MFIDSRSNSRLSVIQVASHYAPQLNGLATHVHEVSRRLASRGIDVTVLTTDPSGRLPREEIQDGVQVRRVRVWPASPDYLFAPGIFRVLASRPWSLVHCQGCHNLIPPQTMLAARRARLPYILTFHSGGHSSRLRTVLRTAHWTALRPLFTGAERLVAVSQFEAEYFQRCLRLPADHFAIIPNGGGLPPPPGMSVTRPAEALIVSPGRLERYKGHHRLIEALPHILAQRPDTRVLVLGSGPYEPALRRLAEHLGVDKQVEIRAIPAENRREMASVLASASLVALLSEYEAHSIAIMEALEVGRPVLVADTSGLREIAQRGLARAIPLSVTPGELATSVLDQLRDPPSTPHVKLPSWDECTEALIAVYKDVLAARAAR